MENIHQNPHSPEVINRRKSAIEIPGILLRPYQWSPSWTVPSRGGSWKAGTSYRRPAVRKGPIARLCCINFCLSPHYHCLSLYKLVLSEKTQSFCNCKSVFRFCVIFSQPALYWAARTRSRRPCSWPHISWENFVATSCNEMLLWNFNSFSVNDEIVHFLLNPKFITFCT